jgi:hypothetical protein
MQSKRTFNSSKPIHETVDPIVSRVKTIQSRNHRHIKQEAGNKTENRQYNLENLNEEEIDQIIKQSRATKKHYARTDIVSYQPLTKNQKIKVLEDLNKDSDKRILHYSELFKEIKTQINSLSNISTNPASKMMSTVKASMDDIREVDDDSEEEKDIYNTLKELSPINKTKPKKNVRIKILNPQKTQSKGLFDWRDSEENIGLIHIPEMNYKSNSIKSVDLISGYKACNMKYKTMNNL